MKQTVKCKYCGKRYAVHDPHDCCPSCGAFNEFEIKEVNQTPSIPFIGKVFSFIWKILCKFGRWFKKLKIRNKLLFLFISFIVLTAVFEEIDYAIWEAGYEDYSFYYSEDLKNNPDAFLNGKGNASYERDYKTSITVFGNFDEIYNGVYKNLIKDQFNRFEYSLASSAKVKYKDTSIFFDKFDLSIGNHSSSLYIDFEIEGNDVPENFDIYFCCGEDISDRVTLTSYEKNYHDSVLDYIFRNEDPYSSFYFDLNTTNIVKYDSFQVEIDGEVHTFDLKYNDDLEVSIQYYGYK